MEQVNEAAAPKKRRVGLTVLCVLLLLLAAAYGGLCWWTTTLDTIFPRIYVSDLDLGGMTAAQAEAALTCAVPPADSTAFELILRLPEGDYKTAPTSPEQQSAALTFADLGGVCVDAALSAQQVFDYCHGSSFLTGGLRYLKGLSMRTELPPALQAEHLTAASRKLANALSMAPQDTAYELGQQSIAITVARDGFSVDPAALSAAIAAALSANDYAQVFCDYEYLPAETRTVESLYAKISGEMKNAGYDAVTDTITPEQVGAEFSAAEAQALLERAAPGETVEVPARIEYPSVTEEALRAVLFRDVLGEARTHVSGTAARISNVQLAAAAFHNVVLNAGDLFSYNETVGQRTVDKGYKPAPAYVKGETVDEIGGGVCQPSSTLYLACLLANLEITERYPHRYAPAYIAWGMDATVSWNGPDYKFTNNTEYPVRIITEYAKGYLTVRLLGTNVDGGSSKMSNQVLSKTPWKTVYQADPAMAPGAEEVVKVTPYTGYTVAAYHTLYNAAGEVLDSHLESKDVYKVRDKVILRAPTDLPVFSADGILIRDPLKTPAPSVTPVTPAEEAPGGETPAEPSDALPAEPASGAAPELPAEPEDAL